MGMTCFGISVITDMGGDDFVVEVSHEEVQKVAKKSEILVGKLVEEFVKQS